MNPDYQPPEKFFISDSVPPITPAAFDQYRFKKDDLADKIAASIYQFSLDWAQHHAEKAEANRASNPRTSRYVTAKGQLHRAEKAFHFFAHIERAIANPHPGDANTEYRYKWDQETIDLAKEKSSEAIKLLDVYFDDDRKEVNDPFAFLFTEEVQKTIERGAKIFEAYGTNVIAILAVRSLLKQYAAFNASNVLVSTKFLTRFPHRRIFETMQFLIDIVTPGSLRKNGVGIIAIKKLRLIHALVRHRIEISDQNINQKFTTWNTNIWGEPINQQDMIFAVHTFSIEIIRGLQKVGYFLDMSEADRLKALDENEDRENLRREAEQTNHNRTIKEDYYLAWHYIGKALGVVDEINPKSYEDGWILQQYIYHTQFRLGDFEEDKAKYPNLTSPVLAEPLLNFIIEILPFTNNRRDALAVVAFYNDEEDYDPVFKDILGLDVKGLANHEFQDFVAGALNLFDRFLEIFYKVKPRMGIGKPRYIKKIGALNRSLFMRLRRMSKNWKGSHFSLRDGVNNDEGFVEQMRRGRRKIHTLFTYFTSFVLMPFLFIFLGPISHWIKRRVARHGHENPRPNFNPEHERYQESAGQFCEKHRVHIKRGDLLISEHFAHAAKSYHSHSESRHEMAN